jgi:hypothetical protein
MPPWFFDAANKTLQICLGVQRMRQLGLFHVPDGGDYGILWPFAIAAIRAPRGAIRNWVMDLLSNWPREGMIVPPPPRKKRQLRTCVIEEGKAYGGGRIRWMCVYGLMLSGHD